MEGDAYYEPGSSGAIAHQVADAWSLSFLLSLSIAVLKHKLLCMYMSHANAEAAIWSAIYFETIKKSAGYAAFKYSELFDVKNNVVTSPPF